LQELGIKTYITAKAAIEKYYGHREALQWRFYLLLHHRTPELDDAHPRLSESDLTAGSKCTHIPTINEKLCGFSEISV
jgi:hypothetical protein